jgi:DNA-binding GntR family transcriptional regulator
VTSPGESAETQSQLAAHRVEAEIVSGALTPGARLGITEMATRFGVGATPLREALSRLVARGLVDAIGQRGFRVKGISRDDLADIVAVRTLIEREALRLSMERGDADWEASIVAALHRLRRFVTANAEGFREGDAEFDALHKSFHVALVAACGSPRMLAALSDLYDQAYRYRRLMMAEFRESGEFIAAHDQLAELAIARRRDEAEQAIGFHIAATLRHVYPEAADRAR